MRQRGNTGTDAADLQRLTFHDVSARLFPGPFSATGGKRKAIGRLTILKSVAWTEVIRNAPKVAERGAKFA
jgi:hypothetical protein